jgi:hypothetical protein
LPLGLVPSLALRGRAQEGQLKLSQEFTLERAYFFSRLFSYWTNRIEKSPMSDEHVTNRGILHGVSPSDPAVYVAAALSVGVVSFAAGERAG